MRLAICAIFKNEAPYLLEWLAYHRAVGFDRFFLYDNGSTDGGADIVRESPFAECATLTHWPARPAQLPAYRHFIDTFRDQADWVAFIDLDEFLLPLEDESIRPVLERAHGFSALMVQWRIFGPSGWDRRPEGLVLDNYTQRTPDSFPANRHVKSIVRCSDLLDVTHNPHEFVVSGVACNTRGEPVPNIGIQPVACHETLVLNHYQTKSRQDWLEKIARGSAMFDYEGPKYEENLFDHYVAESTVADETIKAFLPRVRELLGAPPMHESAPAIADAWLPQGERAFQLEDGSALVFRDDSRPNAPWIAALRRSLAGLIDPTFLTDEAGRIHEFASAEDARHACEAEFTAE